MSVPESSEHYRADIDGLRAVAVILVLLFHVKIGCPGGFIGVDVFFVISGYLITGIIRRKQASGTFCLRDFWGRRIHRILPASVFVVWCTLAAGAMLLFSPDFHDLAKSALSQQFMLANLYFWRDTGYFAGPADLKPLLHTWSLAVEEQFYLFYPFLLILIARRASRQSGAILAVFAGTSLLLSEWGARYYGGAAFYLLPTRAWEMLFGGLLCFLPMRQRLNRFFSEILGFAGTGLVLYAAVVFDHGTRFPGLHALIPCLGACFLIVSNANWGTSIGRVLSMKPFVFTGLISYSLYLWHWPILALLRYRFNGELSWQTGLAALIVSYLLAVFSYFVIEKPFRRARAERPRLLITGGLCATVPVTIAVGWLVIGNDGFPGRYPDAERFLLARESKAFRNEVTFAQIESGAVPHFGADDSRCQCVVWGDSHAMALMPGIDAAWKQAGLSGRQLTHSSTPPLFDFGVDTYRAGMGASVPKYNQSVLRYLQENNVELVILAGFWSSYAHDDEFESKLKETLRTLNAEGIRVAVVLDVANFIQDVPLALALMSQRGQPTRELTVSSEAHMLSNGHCNSIIRAGIAKQGILIDPEPMLTDRSSAWRAEIDGVTFYQDNHHLSVEGGERLTELFGKLTQTRVSVPVERDPASTPILGQFEHPCN